jgi:hypothetical protein
VPARQQPQSHRAIRRALSTTCCLVALAWPARCDQRQCSTQSCGFRVVKIYYQQNDLDGNSALMRRKQSGNLTTVPLTEVSQVLASTCRMGDPAEIFVAPDGGLGLEYDCADDTEFLEPIAAGGFRIIGTLPKGWGNLTTTSGTAFTGVAMKPLPSPYGGTCSGVRAVMDNTLSKPFANIRRLDHTYYLSPPDLTACESRDRIEGVWQPAIRRDGSYLAFLMSAQIVLLARLPYLRRRSTTFGGGRPGQPFPLGSGRHSTGLTAFRLIRGSKE